MDTNGIVREVETTYEQVKSLAGWTVDKNVVLTITSYYVTSEREFNAETLSRAMDALKSKSSWLSPLRGNLLPMLAAFLDKPQVDIERETDCLFEKQRVLRGVGFRNTIHSYLAALLMSGNPELYDHEAIQAKKLYDEMKKQHYFLTSDDDYAYSVLLGKRNENPVDHAKAMRAYYNALRVEKFRSGNELQWMSQVLTYLDITFDSNLVSRAKSVLEYFKRETKVRVVHYPMIGFLAVFNAKEKELLKIVELTRSLEQSPPFKWRKEMALSIAIGYYMQELTDTVQETGISLVASIELIMQAQQAVMAATIAAMAATSSASSSNN
ncbi:DUF4003 family protein [Sporosarcina sp. CAU 1771]